MISKTNNNNIPIAE